MTTMNMSNIYKMLNHTGQKRYMQKISMLGLQTDPYLLPAAGSNGANLPSLEYPDIFNYLINIPDYECVLSRSIQVYKLCHKV